MSSIRKTGGRNELDALWALLSLVLVAQRYAAQSDPAIGDGTTAGFLRTTASLSYVIDGFPATGSPKIATDDAWDLSAEVDTVAATYRAYWLYVDDAGTGFTFEAGTDSPTEAIALQTLAAPDASKSVAGIFVAGPATDFDGVGGLAAQGTIFQGVDLSAFAVGTATDIAAEAPTLIPA